MSPASTESSWIESSDVLSLFPTPAWKIQIRPEVREAIGASILRLLNSLREGLPELKAGEAWQSGHGLHRREEMRELRGCIHRAAASVLEFLKVGERAMDVTGCWTNLYAPGAAHHEHAHPNNFLSGVYYVRTAPGADSINFHDPRSQAAVIRPPVTELAAGNTDQVVVRVANGTLLLFPSYLRHSVDANASGETRISVSFNLMFAAFSESLSKPMWGEE